MKKKYLYLILFFSFVFTFYKVFFQEVFFPPPEPELFLKRDIVRPGESPWQIFAGAELSNRQTWELVSEFARIYNPKRIREGTEYELVMSTSGEFFSFTYMPAANEEYHIGVSTYGPLRYITETRKMPLERSIIRATGTISSSLYAAMTAEGLPSESVIRFAEIFESKIDFFTETMPEDVFRISLEAFSYNGKIVRYGKILAAEYLGRVAKGNAVYYEYLPGRWDYFSDDGSSLKRAFLKAPLSYRRISSHFSRGRMHPILKKVRPHHGIDYSAPSGTPVSALGDGLIIFAGWKGAYGRMVIIRHPEGYETRYGHLSRISKSARQGKKVQMGDVVGYVGSTGLSTGPHLHFEIKKGGKLFNLLKLSLPSRKSIPRNRKNAFRQYASRKLSLLRK